MLALSLPFSCELPAKIHPMCQEYLSNFMAGQTSVHTPAYVCNMVDSSLIPLVECLIKTYANGELLVPLIQ